MTDQLTHIADKLRHAQLTRAGVTNPVPFHALKPSEQHMWHTRAVEHLSAATYEPHTEEDPAA